MKVRYVQYLDRDNQELTFIPIDETNGVYTAKPINNITMVEVGDIDGLIDVLKNNIPGDVKNTTFMTIGIDISSHTISREQALCDMSRMYKAINNNSILVPYKGGIYYCVGNDWFTASSSHAYDIPGDLIQSAYELHLDWFAKKCDEYTSAMTQRKEERYKY